MTNPSRPTTDDTLLQYGLIYGPTGIATLLSRGWNLFRKNLKASLMLMMVPALLQTCVAIFWAIPASLPLMTGMPQAAHLGLTIGSIFIGLGVSIVSWFISLFCFGAISRIFYSGIIDDKPIGIRQSLKHIASVWKSLLGLFVLLFIVYTVFAIIDIFVFVVGFVMTAFLLSFTASLIGKGILGNAISVLLAIVVGGLDGLLVIALISVQIALWLFPIVAVVTAPRPDTINQLIYSWKVLFKNLPRVALFGFLSLVLIFVLIGTLQAPAYLWMVFELSRIGQPNHGGVLPLHVTVVSSIWGTLIQSIIIPFNLGAFTLFWYDCQTRSDGLDLRLGFNQLLMRKKNQYPELNNIPLEAAY